MIGQRDRQLDRRAWLMGLGRWGALGGLSVLVWHLLARAQDEPCDRSALPCSDCGLLAQCRLPRAVAVHHARRS